MKLIVSILAIFALGTFIQADDNHEIIEKVMKEGMKGKTSPIAKTLEGKATDEEIKALSELIATLKGTKAPVGDQAAYDEKVTALIAAAGKVASAAKDADSIAALKKASNCKACHDAHKPKE